MPPSAEEELAGSGFHLPHHASGPIDGHTPTPPAERRGDLSRQVFTTHPSRRGAKYRQVSQRSPITFTPISLVDLSFGRLLSLRYHLVS
jgi:hypothetical protein